MWLSILHHISNIHSCDSADLYHQCAHPPLSNAEARTKKWLTLNSPAHEALKAVVMDRNLLKDIQQLSLCCHTGKLKVYHSVYTKYSPKRQHFSFKGMVARTQLTALDHNANAGRQQAYTSIGDNEGKPQYKVVFPKHTKKWVAKPVMAKTTQDHLKPMLDTVVARKSKKKTRKKFKDYKTCKHPSKYCKQTQASKRTSNCQPHIKICLNIL